MQENGKDGIHIPESAIEKTKKVLSHIGLGIFGLALLRVIIYPPKRNRKNE